MSTIAIIATNGFEYSELTKPKDALLEAGHAVHVISPADSDKIKAAHDNGEISIDQKISDVNADDYDLLILPGGVSNPDKLRLVDDAIKFVQSFNQNNKPIAAICHGSWTLINAEVISGKKMTSWPSLQKDLENAGATWVDQEVVVDGNLITSRNPDDLPAFNKQILETLN